MKRLSVLGVLLLGLLSATTPIQAVVYVGGPITGDTSWTARDTIVAIECVLVRPNAKLTIEPGTVVRFGLSVGLWVDGELWAFGTPEQHILLTAASDTVGGDPFNYAWSGIEIRNGNKGILGYCDIRYAINACYVYKAYAECYGCTVENFVSRGFYADGYDYPTAITLILNHCTVSQTASQRQGMGIGVFVYRYSSTEITNCSIEHCQTGISLYGLGALAPTFSVNGCDIRHNSQYGIEIIGAG